MLDLLNDVHIISSEVVSIPQEDLRHPNFIDLCKHGHFLFTEIASSRVKGLIQVVSSVNIDGWTRLPKKIMVLYQHFKYKKTAVKIYFPLIHIKIKLL